MTARTLERSSYAQEVISTKISIERLQVPVKTFWLHSKPPVPGLDQVGIRSSSIRLYNHLVPGFTNQTTRARYFSVHAYTIDLWARQFATNEAEKLQRFFRRVECVLGLAEKITEGERNESSYAIVGTDAIRRWLKQCPDPLPDNFKVPLKILEENYFGNKWGAFGQYYGGSESALRLISWREDGLPGLMLPLGPELANAFKTAADKVRLFDLLNESQPRVKDFRRIGTELSFSNLTGNERTLLRQVFLDSTNTYGAEGARRRDTLLLLLAIAQQSSNPIDDPAWTILKMALYGRSEHVSLVCPSSLLNYLELWRIYALHELLAFSLEVFLVACIEEVGILELDSKGPAQSVVEVSQKLASLLPYKFARKRFGELVEEGKLNGRMSASEPPASNLEEITLRESAKDALKEGNLATAITCALKLLARVSAQLRTDNSAYELFLHDTSLDSDRLSLDTLSRYTHKNTLSTLGETAKHWISLAANTHMRVATAKLAYNKDFTYKIAFDGGRLRKIGGTEPAFSSPRLSQAAQMLADVGFLNLTNEGYSITPSGTEVLRSHGCLT